MPLSGRSLRQQMLVYTLATLALTLGLVLLVAWIPLRNRLYDSVENDLAHEIRLRSEALEEILRRASDLGWQISSRTAARQLMTDLLDGRVDLAQAGTGIEQKLRDAMLYSEEIRGVARQTLDGRTVTVVLESGQTLDTLLAAGTPYRLRGGQGKTSSQEGQMISAPIEQGGRQLFVIRTPVFAPDGRLVGRDRIFFDVGELERELARPLAGAPSARALLLDPRRSLQNSLLSSHGGLADSLKGLDWRSRFLPLAGAEIRLDRERGLWLVLAPLPSTGWAVALVAPAGELTAEARRWLTSILFTVLGVGLLGIFGSLALMRPLADRMLVEQRELGDQLKELTKTKAELQRRGEHLARSNEDLRHFAYATAHDLKSPLITVAGHARLLSDHLGEGLAPGPRRSLEHIQHASRQMVQLVDDLLSYSRAGDQPLRIEELDPAALCHDIVTSLQGTRADAEHCVTIEELPAIRADRTLLRLVLQNLIDNALRYQLPDRPPRIVVSGRSESGHWVLRVRDNGIGIDPSSQDIVFNLFERLHSQDHYPGSGIGLAICRRAVDRMGGEIVLESALGEGSTFTIRLPKRDAIDEQRAEAQDDDRR